MKRGSIFVLSCSVLLTGSSLQAQEGVLMRALRDELGRTMEKLQLQEMEKPYFVAYRVREETNTQIAASLGGIVSRRENSDRFLSVEVRVGDHDLDNTNFFAMPERRSGVVSMYRPFSLPLGDDYKELRRQIWLATDGAYKQALDRLSKKRAVLQNKTRAEVVPDFSVEEPYQFAGDRPSAELDTTQVEALARGVSAVFKGMPDIFASKVQADVRRERTYYVNSEGSRFTRSSPAVSIHALAGTQAADGTELEDFLVAYGRSWEDLPSQQELANQVRGMVERLGQLRKAEFVDRYTGPVLFEGQAAAELVSQVLLPRLLAIRVPVTDNSRFEMFMGQAGNPFVDKLGARILPRFLSIVDNPTVEKHGEVPLLGGYPVDDDGVRARETKLVQRGILKTLLATRSPVSGVLKSTGNRRNAGPAPSNLFVVAQAGMEQDEIKKELLSLVQERGGDYGIIVRRIGNPLLKLPHERQFPMMIPGQSERSNVEPTILAYKIFPDGREEPIRKAVLSGISESSFRDIVAATKSQTEYNVAFQFRGTLPFSFSSFGLPGSMVPPVASLVVPSLLFEDLTLKRPSGNVPRPPVAPHPSLDR